MRRNRRPQFSQDLFRTTARRGRAVNGNFGAFGTPSSVGNGECPVPDVGMMPYPLDVRKASGSLAKTWCSCVFGTTSELARACVGPDYWLYPWTALGKAERGWNFEFTDLIPTLPGTGSGSSGGGSSGGGGSYVPPVSQPSSNTGLIAAAALAAAAFFMK